MGRDAAQYNREMSNQEGQVEHPDCEDCSHINKWQYNLKLMFTIEDPIGITSLNAAQLAEQLADALPREWWQDSNVADWGTVAIFPLKEDGELI
jgi:hypothetical protein